MVDIISILPDKPCVVKEVGERSSAPRDMGAGECRGFILLLRIKKQSGGNKCFVADGHTNGQLFMKTD